MEFILRKKAGTRMVKGRALHGDCIPREQEDKALLFINISPYHLKEPHLSLEDGPNFSVGRSVVHNGERGKGNGGLVVLV